MRALIVDDERVARRELRRLLEAHPEIEIIGEAANGDEAISPKDSARSIARYWYEVLSESKFAEMLKIGKDLQDKHAAAMRESRDGAKAKVLRGE